MSVRNDHELPRSQADASDDAHPETYQGPLEVQEAIELIVASLPVMAEHVSSIPDAQKATALDALERHYSGGHFDRSDRAARPAVGCLLLVEWSGRAAATLGDFNPAYDR